MKHHQEQTQSMLVWGSCAVTLADSQQADCSVVFVLVRTLFPSFSSSSDRDAPALDGGLNALEELVLLGQAAADHYKVPDADPTDAVVRQEVVEGGVDAFDGSSCRRRGR